MTPILGYPKGETLALLERHEAALTSARHALDASRQWGERPLQASALRLRGDIAVADHHSRLESAAAADYGEALAIADTLGMRPLMAHCHLGLGKMHRRMGKREPAQEHLTTATTMYREMDMDFWLAKAACRAGLGIGGWRPPWCAAAALRGHCCPAIAPPTARKLTKSPGSRQYRRRTTPGASRRVSGQLRTGRSTADMAGASATRAVIVALLVAHIASLVCSVTGWAGVIDVDPEVRTLVNAGRARVLVSLLVADSGDEAVRAAAIGRAQDTVLSRLPRSHGSLLRRYASVPLLSLEIDAIALLALEQMPDVVAAVKLDRTAAPQ